MSRFTALTAGWFAERFPAPTAAQERGWPAIAAGSDTLIAAPTGSGKTLTAFLHCLDDLVRRAQANALPDRTLVVYVSPLRALSNDIRLNLLAPLGEISARAQRDGVALPEIRVGVRTGDTSASERQAMARRPPHVLVTTPESLYLLVTSKRGRENLANVKTVIVDEIHALAPDRRGAHLALTLERLDTLVAEAARAESPLLASVRPQRIGLSATQRPVERVADFLTGGRKCTIVDLGHARALDLELCAPAGELAAVCSHEQWGDIHDQVAKLVGQHKSTIVFTNTRRMVERTAAALSERLGEQVVAAHHGAMSQRARLDAEQRLKASRCHVIVATASLELGIDVGDVDLVCQIGSPRAIKVLLQRVGRAGHALLATPKGRVFALTRDDLIECTALLRAVRAGRLDALCVPDGALDILAQQMVAASTAGDWDEQALYDLARRAYPYRALSRSDFDAVLEMLAEGVATRRGRSSAHLHHDRVNRRIKARRGARLAAIRSGGAIPDRADYEVIADPEGIRVGTLDEDYAIESSSGDIFQLGNMSWRIRRIESGRVRVEDAHGQPPSIPFWLGEAPGRTAELSEEVGRLRDEVATQLEQSGDAAPWLEATVGLERGLGRQLSDYVAATRAALGAVPSQKRIVAERFFDEGGGMQLVLHAPFGARLNRAWGLALRKRFCRSFDFELQAAATDDGIILSLGAQHSFPLETVFDMVPAHLVRPTLVQAALQAPMFGTRWRWNATRSLAILRYTGKGKVPAPLLRIRSEDLLAAVFPASQGCQDNHGGVMKEDVEPPDHPLVNQTFRDCLEEAMDVHGLISLLERIAAGEIEVVGRDTPEPSPMSHQILNANPYAYLDDAPLEERRTRAVTVRRGLPADIAGGVGALDDRAIATVRADAWPSPRDADELHDALLSLIVLPETDVLPAWGAWFEALASARRATRATVAGGKILWVAAERLHMLRAAYGDDVVLAPAIDTPAGSKAPSGPDEARKLVVRGRMECHGPAREAELAAALALPEETVAIACAELEGDGLLLRGAFLPGEPGLRQWCDRRLLARIHQLTLGRLRREIEPQPPAQLARFVRRWQHAEPGAQLHGVAGLEAILDQLQGVEAPVGAWEREILPARVADYAPALLDELCLAGEFVWGRRSISNASITTRATPIAFWRRASTPWMFTPVAEPAAAAADVTPEVAATNARIAEAEGAVVSALATRGALFYAELLEATGLLRAQLDGALWALVAEGRLTADGFGALRTLAAEAPRRTGRWSLLGAGVTLASDEVRAEQHARHLLARYGVVFRELATREILPPWRDILLVLRRLEARGDVRGGRFVAGFVGEQFAVPTAVAGLRALRPDPSQASTSPLHIPATLAARDPIVFVEQAVTRLPNAPIVPIASAAL
jgi:ATP-dependent Lhr-like helicase